jgi:hypothetical protein
VLRFYADHFIGHQARDMQLVPVPVTRLPLPGRDHPHSE